MVLLDASAIIYLLEGDEPTRQSVRDILNALHVPEPPALAVSALSRLECRVKPRRDGDNELLAAYDAFFDDPGLLVLDLDRDVLDCATELRARYRLRTPDALQAASLLAHETEGDFVTGDADFLAIPGLRVHRA